MLKAGLRAAGLPRAKGGLLSETPLWFLVIQLLTTIAVVATFIAYLGQLRLMQRQLEASKQSTLAQNTLAVVQFLSDPELRVTRGVVLQKLDGKPFQAWTEEERGKANRVCSSYDMVGMLARAGIVDSEIIVRNWGSSIRKAYAVTLPYISDLRDRVETPTYWDNFEWLAQAAGLDREMPKDTAPT